MGLFKAIGGAMGDVLADQWREYFYCDSMDRDVLVQRAYKRKGKRGNNKGGDNLLFFSVPYDRGWTAYVNGEKTDIEIVNIGFMAVKVPGGTTSTIEFRYQTPFFKVGCIISAAAFGVMLLYLIAFRGFRAKRALRKRYRIKQKTQIQGGSL